MFRQSRIFFLKLRRSKGFTLIEVLVTASLIVFVSVTLIRNFSASKLNLERVANVFAFDIRLAQSLALSPHQFQSPEDPVSRNRCGYGITQKDDSGVKDPTTYMIFAGPSTIKPNGQPNDCNSRKHKKDQSTPVYKTIVLDTRLELDDKGFKDIFFEPPGPTTYINDSNTSPLFEQIIIKKTGLKTKDCSSATCIYICVYLSGRVEVTKDSTLCQTAPTPTPTATVTPTPTPTATVTPTPTSTVTPPNPTVCNGGIDVGLRLYQDGVRKVAIESSSLTSPLRVYKAGVNGVVLVPVSDPNASRVRIQTSAGIRAICLLP